MASPTRSHPFRGRRALPPTARPHGGPPAIATTAVLLATADADGGVPTAMLAWRGGTIVGALVEQLGALGVTDVLVITRPRWARAVAAALDGSPVPTTVRPCEDTAADLRAIAHAARAGDGPLVVAHAGIVVQGQVLAGLLADPRISTGILATTGWAGGADAYGVRLQRGRVVAAASPQHRVRTPNARFLGVLKIAGPDRAVAAAQCERLAALAHQPQEGPPDAAALAVVGLVRAATPVGVSYLRSLFWARPAGTEDVAMAAEQIDAVDEDDALLDAAVKATDGFFTTFFVSPYSRYIARWAARRGLTPNIVTTASLVVGLAAAACFALGDRIGLVAGAVLLQAAFTLDCVDGQLARYTRQFSKLGAWLDSVFDRAKEYAVFAGLAIGAAHAGDPVWVLAGAALTLQTVRHMLDFAYAAAQHERLAALAPLPLEQVDDVAGPPPTEAPAPDRRSRRAAVMGVWRALDRRGAVWVKRVIAFPIGERFATISIVAALWSARTVFVVLLAWGGLAAVYSIAGRLLRTRRAADSAVRSLALDAYRDDGPLARRLLAPSLGRVTALPGPLLVALGAAAPLAGVAAEGDAATHLLAALAIGWFVLVAGASRGRPRSALDWATPGLLRVGEYASVLWIAALAGPSTLPAAFALLCVVAFHQYDLVYRLRHRGETPPAWTDAVQLGWDGRLLLALVLLIAGALPAGMVAWAGLLAIVLVGESAVGWALTQRLPRQALDDEDDEL